MMLKQAVAKLTQQEELHGRKGIRVTRTGTKYSHGFDGRSCKLNWNKGQESNSIKRTAAGFHDQTPKLERSGGSTRYNTWKAGVFVDLVAMRRIWTKCCQDDSIS